jgi:hypothetical protein
LFGCSVQVVGMEASITMAGSKLARSQVSERRIGELIRLRDLGSVGGKVSLEALLGWLGLKCSYVAVMLSMGQVGFSAWFAKDTSRSAIAGR